PLTGGFFRQLARHAPAQPRLADQNRFDDVAAHCRLDAAARRFDFRKLGHSDLYWTRRGGRRAVTITRYTTTAGVGLIQETEQGLAHLRSGGCSAIVPRPRFSLIRKLARLRRRRYPQ